MEEAADRVTEDEEYDGSDDDDDDSSDDDEDKVMFDENNVVGDKWVRYITGMEEADLRNPKNLAKAVTVKPVGEHKTYNFTFKNEE